MKFLVVTEWRHAPRHTLDSSNFFLSAGMIAHNLAAGPENFVMVSTVMVNGVLPVQGDEENRRLNAAGSVPETGR